MRKTIKKPCTRVGHLTRADKPHTRAQSHDHALTARVTASPNPPYASDKTVTRSRSEKRSAFRLLECLAFVIVACTFKRRKAPAAFPTYCRNGSNGRFPRVRPAATVASSLNVRQASIAASGSTPSEDIPTQHSSAPHAAERPAACLSSHAEETHAAIGRMGAALSSSPATQCPAQPATPLRIRRSKAERDALAPSPMAMMICL